MAAKGSRKNPYTLSEFNGIGSDSWTGGWIKESDNYIIYRNRYLTETYTGRCAKVILYLMTFTMRWHNNTFGWEVGLEMV